VSDGATDRPALSVLIGTRQPLSALRGVFDATIPQVRAVGGEIVVVSSAGDDGSDAPPEVRFLSMDGDHDMMRLRACGLVAVRGQVIAIGEDHAYPSPGWAEAVLRAHAEHPTKAVIVGCLINRTTRTTAARANFLAYAAPFSPPMPEAPPRPPPASAVTIKREALDGADLAPGCFETELLPQLFEEGRMASDDAIRVDHYQDFNTFRAIRSAFAVARASYGYARARWDRRQQWATARWAFVHVAPLSIREARAERARAESPRRDLIVVGLIAVALGIGAVVGTFWGPGGAAFRTP